MEEKKDYYKILDIDKNLPEDEFKKVLRKNYKRLCLKYHPDKNPGDKEAEDSFKDINEAYQVLSDPQKRSEYDNPMSGFHFSGNPNMDDVFQQFSSSFGFNPFGGFGFGPNPNVKTKGRPISGTITFTLEDAFYGKVKTFKFKKSVVCHNCHGTGKDKHTTEETCQYCHGYGRIRQSSGYVTVEQTCPHCGGSGKIITNPCSTCDGTGLEYIQVEQNFEISKGASDGMTFTLSEIGNEILWEGNLKGDVVITLKQVPHDKFGRNGDNLSMTLNIPLLDAILGTTITIETISKKNVEVTIPQCSKEGDIITLKGEGLPNFVSNVLGDLLCTIHLIMPDSLSEEELELYKTIKKLNND